METPNEVGINKFNYNYNKLEYKFKMQNLQRPHVF